jgi:hypothetical protein
MSLNPSFEKKYEEEKSATKKKKSQQLRRRHSTAVLYTKVNFHSYKDVVSRFVKAYK